MKTYMVYSRNGGTIQGAFLVFAHSVREAKKVAWPQVKGVLVGEDDYTDLAVKQIRGEGEYLSTLADVKLLRSGIAHVVQRLPSCTICLTWDSRLGDDGLCDCCRIFHAKDCARS